MQGVFHDLSSFPASSQGQRYHQARGAEAEQLAARHLQGSGLHVIERNFRVRGGEIDLICRDGRPLVFVEVRLRSRGDFGGAAASITAAKRGASSSPHGTGWLRQGGTDCRFDCVLLDGVSTWNGCAMRLLLTISLPCWLARAALAESIRILVQSSPLAGFQYYAARELWQDMQVGDRLTLVREPDNPHDANAVRVEWRGQKLGYLPRAENRAVAAAMDAATRLRRASPNCASTAILAAGADSKSTAELCCQTCGRLTCLSH